MSNTIPTDATGLPAGGPMLTEEAIEQVAAFSFEPLVHKPDEWTPPSNEESRSVLATTRLAWDLLFKTKEELVDSLDELWSTKEGADAFQAWTAHLRDSRICLERCAQILEMAEMRLLCADAAGCAAPEGSAP